MDLGMGLGFTVRRGASVLTVVSDTFTRADSAATLGSAETGQAWTANAGTWGISSNKGYVATAGGANDIATVNAGVADCSVQVTITAGAITGQGVILRLTDVNNYVYCFASDSTHLVIGTDVASSFNTLANQAYSWSSGDTLKVVLSGQSVSAYVNGALITSTTTSVNQSATKHGLLSTAAAAATSRWDNFLVTVP